MRFWEISVPKSTRAIARGATNATIAPAVAIPETNRIGSMCEEITHASNAPSDAAHPFAALRHRLNVAGRAAALLKVVLKGETRMKLHWLLVVTSSLALAALCMPNIAAASDRSDVTATIARAVAAFNNGDMTTWAAACASPASIIDDFPPHEWQGATACTDWASAYSAMVKKAGIANGIVTLGTPGHLAVTGNRAYAVYPATYSFKQKGKPVKEAGIFTFALKKAATGWLFTGWAWADR